ncbi:MULTISPECIES: hypothetical protein [unclassified Methylobacterium]|uniref:hypothetical protein n=1 Tax=unclassified Methylobacterium TaxID=2615210 RepID=UPI0006F4EB04|nr:MULTISPECIES: hypothetical protein [unclassified Methylobacterium]KQO59660.1 hypothetical protein ASF22_08485 [Methylobacterium sp. Leaf87]KQP60950.1 hypothetical protein ASF52_07440 [Methylobacterium sp. Leaf112]
MNLTPVDAERKAQAEALFRETDKTVREIAAETKLSAATLRKWCRQETWRPPIAKTAPAAWSPARCAALARVDRAYGVTRADLAAVLGLTRRTAPALFSSCGLPEAAEGPPPGPAILRVALLTHITRQVAAFDVALKEAPPGLDSARVLRDLGGLKRLLDDLAAAPRSDPDATRGAHTDGPGDAGSGTDPDAERDTDLPALRAQIARRYAAFVGERPDAGFPGEPAATSDPGARP